MCGWEIQFPKAILAVDFNRCNQLMVVTHDGLVHFFNLFSVSETIVESPGGMEILRKEGRHLRPVWTATSKLDLPNYALMYQWRWVNNSTLVACLANQLLVLELAESTISIKYCFYHYFYRTVSYHLLLLFIKRNIGTGIEGLCTSDFKGTE